MKQTNDMGSGGLGGRDLRPDRRRHLSIGSVRSRDRGTGLGH